MTRTLYVIVDLSVNDDADDEAIADFVRYRLVLDALCARDDAPYESCDGTEWQRGEDGLRAIRRPVGERHQRAEDPHGIA